MTWSQKYFLPLLQWDQKNKRRHNIGCTWTAPSGTTVEQVLDIFLDLIRTCESLRTTYTLDGTEPRQIVRDSGEFPVHLHEASDDEMESCTYEAEEELLSPDFDITGDIPIRLAVVKTNDQVRRVVAAYCHMAVDGSSMRIIWDLVRARLSGTPTEALVEQIARSQQPVDRADHERSPSGQRMSQRAREFWTDAFRELPTAMYEGRLPTESCTEQAWIHSHRAARAVRDISQDYHVAGSPALLGALSVVLSAALGESDIAIQSLFSTRFSEQRHHSIGCTIQNGLFRTDVRDVPVMKFMEQSAADFTRSARHSQYDPNLLHAELDTLIRHDGGSFHQFIYFNNITAIPRLTAHEFGQTGTDWHGVGCWCSDGRTEYDLEDHSAPAKDIKFLLMVYNLRGSMDCWLFIDRRFFPAGVLRILQSLELVLESSARNPDLHVSELLRDVRAALRD